MARKQTTSGKSIAADTGAATDRRLFAGFRTHAGDETRALPLPCGTALFTVGDAGNRITLKHIDTAACQLFGITAQDVLGASLDRICDQSSAKLIADLFAHARTDGSIMQFTVDSPRGEQGGTIIGSVRAVDSESLLLVVSELRSDSRLAEAISRGKHEWEQTVDAIDDSITILDPDLSILRANRAAHERLGYRLGELVGKKCYAVFQGEQEPCPECPVIPDKATVPSRRSLVRNRLLNKTYDVSSTHIHDKNGDLRMIIHVARDVTDTINQEEERKRLSTAIEHTSEVVVITDVAGTIQYVNPAFTTITGYRKEEALGRNMNLLKSGRHDRAFYQQMWNILLSGQVWHGRIINKAKDGSLFTETSTISPIFDADGTISAFVAVKRDVSREEHLEKQLQQAVKLEAIGTLAGGIAHDFNNILSAILGYGQIAKSMIKHGDQLEYPLNHILAAGERAADLIEQILTFSRQSPDREQLRPLKVQPIIKEALKLLRSSIPATITMSSTVDNQCPPVMADPIQVHQVIMNLCTNARQAIESEHGEITVEVGAFALDDTNRENFHTSLPSGAYLKISVADNGCGIDETTMPRIFDPFFTTKPKEGGTGLGLAVVHGIVKKHHGDIFANSSPGHGSTFTVLLPAIDDRPAHVPIKKNQIRGGNEHLLLVDDEQQLTDMLTMALERLGYRVTAFNDSLAAVTSFREHCNDFDLVITDMTMPNMTGVELSREMLSIRPGLPIVLMTGYHERINRDTALRIGIREFFQKPLRKQDLAHTIRTILDHASNPDH